MRERLPSYTGLHLERRDGILCVTIANPRSPMNTIDAELHAELAHLFQELRYERDARVVLLRSDRRVFSAGGDLGWFDVLRSDRMALDELRHEAKQMIWDLLDVEIPVVSALNGHTMGLAATITLLSDWVVMAESATIADPHVRIGVAAGDGGAAIWPVLLGPLRAKQYLLTGDAMTAVKAVEIGLVNEMVPDDEVDARAWAVARRLASAAPLAVRFTKVSVNKLVKHALNVAFDTSLALEIVTILSDDQSEAVAALRERRDPVFTGR